jgi:predicted dehydrogenase
MRIAIIGLGKRVSSVWVNIHTAAHGQMDLIAYADPNPTNGIETLEQSGLNLGTGYEDHRRMLREEKPDAVLIGSPNHFHLQHITDALAAGCKVFTEKPVTISPEDTWDIAQLIKHAAADQVLVGLVLRSSPFFHMIRQKIATIGQIISMEANEHLVPGHGGFLMRDWRRKRKWSGSHILEKCCHDIDLLQAICGRAARVASFGARSIFIPTHQHLQTSDRYQSWWNGWQSTEEVFHSDADICDNQVAIIETESGVRLSWHCNNHLAHAQRRWLIAGTEGMIEGDLTDSTIHHHRIDADKQTCRLAHTEASGHYGADAAMAENIVATWLKNTPFNVPAKAALEAGLTCMAIDQAQRTGEVIDVRPLMQRLDEILP